MVQKRRGPSHGVWVSDPDFPERFIKPNADGSINITGSISSETTAVATVAAPAYTEGVAEPLSQDLDGNLRVTVAGGTSSTDITAVGGNAVTTTIPVSGTVGATIADGSNTTQGAIANAAYNGTDPTTGQGYLRAIADAALSATPASTNLTQVAGTSVATGSGVLGAGTQRVVLATDQPAVAVTMATGPLPTGAATLVGQTDVQAPITPATATATKTLLLGGTYLSTLPTFTNAQQGALQVGTRGSLNVTMFGADSAQSIVGLADNANGVAANSGARNLGVMATLRGLNGSGSYDRLPGDTAGLVNQQWALTGSRWQYAAAASGISNTTTAVTFIAAAGASVRNYVTGIQIDSTALGAATELAIRDGAGGAVLWRGFIGTAGYTAGRDIVFATPLKGTANTLMEVVTLTASVTGAVYFNAQGFTAP